MISCMSVKVAGGEDQKLNHSCGCHLLMVPKQISSSNCAFPQKNATENNDKKAKVKFWAERFFSTREVRDSGRNGDFLQHSFILPWFPSFGLSSRYEPLKDGNYFSKKNELTSRLLVISEQCVASDFWHCWTASTLTLFLPSFLGRYHYACVGATSSCCIAASRVMDRP